MSTAQVPVRLDRAHLAGLAPGVGPLVAPAELRPRVLHLGLGAFHRAHQAVVTEAAAAGSGQPWGIAAVAPRSRTIVSALRAQDGLYSVLTHQHAGPDVHVVGALVEALHLGEDAARVDDLLADPSLTVVTTTLTEKGHHLGPDGSLDPTDPAIAADLAAPGAERSAVGRLAAGLARRARESAAPLALVSCDNLAGNGRALARAVLGFVGRSSWPDRDAVLDRLAGALSFPDTVVDRIVPATSDADRDAVAAVIGRRDEAPVAAEPYLQWVIEDRFPGPRPPWEHHGATLVDDVEPFALSKLRLLNGAHSALAYLGAASGHATIAEAMTDDWAEPLVLALAAEVAPTLPAGGPDPLRYAAETVTRFRAPGLHHRLAQIGSDGTRKLPERWLAPLRALGHAPVLTLALAGWVLATAPDGPLPDAGDPAADDLAACWTRSDPSEVVRGLLGVLGAADLADDRDLVATVVAHLPALRAGRVPRLDS